MLSTLSGLIADPYETMTDEFFQYPYPVYKVLRETQPVFYSKARRCWVITRYEDVHFAYKDASIDTRFEDAADKFQQKVPPGLQCPVSKVLERFRPAKCSWMASQNQPLHTHMKRLLGSTLTPARVEELRPSIEQLCQGLVSQARSRGTTFDIMSEYACVIPFSVIARLLGLPQDDLLKIKRWCDQIMPMFDIDSSESAIQDSMKVFEEYTNYLEPVVKQRRKQRRMDSTNNLMTEAFETNPDGYRLTDRQIAANIAHFTFSGFETTEAFIANSMYDLLRHPDQFELLKQNPDLIESAVEELLRFDAPTQFHIRPVSQVVSLGSATLRQGDKVMIVTGSANRDSEVFVDPDRLDICRQANKHLSFGFGTHYCIGAYLSRVEAQIAINTLVQQLPNLRLTTSSVRYKAIYKLRKLESLPVVFG